jgi:PIN domain nuclease of toxin-antitoxin system
LTDSWTHHFAQRQSACLLQHNARAVELPRAYPKDPADRIIAATALVEGLSLITADREIRRSKVVHTIW